MARIRGHYQGFTLIEVLVVLALIVILVSFAIPSYKQYLQQAQRIKARHTLVMLAQKLEQHYHINNNYNLDLTTWIPEDSHYTYHLESGNNQQSFILMADPHGSQKNDVCGTLLLNQNHVRGAGGQLANREELTIQCWER
jgi:type IV pilus assembly protein PilE